MQNLMKIDFDVYFITDSSFGWTHEQLAEMVLRAGIKVIQFREKNMSTKQMFETAKRLRKLTEDYGATFIVNDRVDLALKPCRLNFGGQFELWYNLSGENQLTPFE